MIAEAVDAALLLWQALWVWLLAGAVVVTLAGLGTVAGVWWAVNAVRNALSARLPAGRPPDAPRLPQPRERPATPRQRLPVRRESSIEAPSRPRSPRQSAPQAPGGPFPAPNPERPSDARMRPSRARTDKEAA